jgi:hypothetical protein
MRDVFLRYAWGEGWASNIPQSSSPALLPGKDGNREAEGDVVTVFTPNGVQKMSPGQYDRQWRQGRGAVLSRFRDPERLWRVAEEWQGVRPDPEAGILSRGDGKVRARL